MLHLLVTTVWINILLADHQCLLERWVSKAAIQNNIFKFPNCKMDTISTLFEEVLHLTHSYLKSTIPKQGLISDWLPGKINRSSNFHTAGGQGQSSHEANWRGGHRWVRDTHLCPSPYLHCSSFSFHWTGKGRGGHRRRGNAEGTAELQHWRVGSAEASTSG